MSEQFTAVRADVVWEANTGQAIADIGDLGEQYLRTTGAMSDEALRLAAAQDRLTRTIARSGPESTAAKTATLNYRRELGSLRAEAKAAADAELARGRASVTVAEQARTNIASVTGQQRALAALAVEYRRVAAAAVAGSDEQVAAAKLAERALLQLGAANTRASAGGVVGGSRVAQEERTGARLGRGALAGAGVSGELSRALVFGSTAFVGAYGLASAVKSVTDAATAQQAAEGQLETALRNRGQAIAQLRGQIEAEVAANAQLGFGEADTTKALTLGVTATGSLAGATRLLAVAHNVARAKGTDLATATQLLVRAFEGQSRSLKALGVDVKAGTKGYEILDQVQGKYSGRAIAYANSEAGARERLRAELERTKVTIGNELLPVEDKLATSLANYLGKASNQAKIQRDVNEAMKVGGEVAHDFGAVAQFVETHLGGWKNALELLIALKVGSVFAGWAGSVIKFRNAIAAASKVAAGAGALTAVEGEVAAVGGAAVVAEGSVGLLGTALAALPAELTIGLTVAVAYEIVKHLPGGAGTKAIEGLFTGKTSLTGSGQNRGGADVAVAYRGGFIEGQTGTSDGAILQKIANGQPLTAAETRRANEIVKAGQSGTAEGTTYFKGSYQHLLKTSSGNPTILTPKPKPDTGFRGADLSAPGAGGRGGSKQPPPLDRLTKINLALAAAQRDIARGDKGAQQEYIKALKDQIDYEQAAEQTQIRLIKTDPAHAKQHAQELAQAYSDEQSARDTITSIQQAEAQKSAAARAKALAQLKAADAKKRKDYQAALDLRESILKRDVAGATTIPSTRKAEDTLTAFYKKEADDAHLTRLQREHYATLAQKEHALETANLKKLTEKDLENRVAQAKLTVDKAKGNADATTKAIVAEKASLAALIKFYDADATNKNLTVAARQEAKRKEIAEQTALATLDKKQTPTDFAAIERGAISTLQEIIHNQSNVSAGPSVVVNQNFPHPPTNDGRREAILAHRAAQAAFA